MHCNRIGLNGGLMVGVDPMGQKPRFRAERLHNFMILTMEVYCPTKCHFMFLDYSIEQGNSDHQDYDGCVEEQSNEFYSSYAYITANHFISSIYPPVQSISTIALGRGRRISKHLFYKHLVSLLPVALNLHMFNA